MLRGAGIFVLVLMTPGCSLVGQGVNWIYAQSQDRKLPERVVAANHETQGWLYDLELSPDETVAATATWWGVELHRPEDLKRFRVISDEKYADMNTCGDLDWSPDGKLIACALWKNWNNVVLYSYEEDRIVRVLRGHTNPCYRVEFSPDGKLVASIPDDWTEVSVWRVETGELVWEHGYSDESPAIHVLSISFSPDGQSSHSGSTGAWSYGA